MAKQSPGVREKENSSKTPVTNLDQVLLENARLTSEVQRLLKENEQRNAELAIISSVQQGLASKLDFQSIIDLVGDQVHAITNANSISIALYDKTSEMLSWPYWLTFGKRVEIPSRPMEKGITRRVMYAKKALNLSTEQEILANDAIPPQEGWTVGKSYLGVPFTVGHRILGALSLHDFDNEHAFHESDERLLQTLANSMSIALENARLFDETEQRAAELTIINSVQEGLASKLDIQAIYDLVGDKIREFFHNIDAEIRICDPKAKLIHIPYITDMGKRIVVDPLPLTDVGVSAYVLHTRRTLVINENILQEMEKYGSKLVPGGHQAKSAVFVPLVVNHQARGLLVLGDVEHEHAFSSSDVRLLETLANSMSTALENARLFDETQRLLKETEQRNVELSMINSVQQGLASKLDMQAIYDLVGDKIRDLLNAPSVWIITFDPETQTRRVRYSFEHGQRYYISELFPYNKLTEHLIATKKPLVINQNFLEAIARFEMINMAGTQEQIKSIVYIPIMAGEDVKGFISLPNIERENAFSESDVNLLSTFALAMSIALENIRLFDETQRLLKETEQRAAELQIINSVQEGLVSKLDMQAIYDLVGDKIRDLFSAQSVWILTFDRIARTRRVEYSFENGQRYYTSNLLPFNKLTEYLIATKKTFVINHDADVRIAEFEMSSVAGTGRFKSAIFVPLMTDGEVKGFISLQNIEKENAFSESDISLLSTLASSMSVALENARLFDETQRLLRETEQRNAELAIINSVQEGLASKLDMQAIYDLVGDKIRDLLDAQSIWILTLDPATRTRQDKYAFEKGQRYPPQVLPYNKLTEHLIATKKSLVINQDAEARIAEFEIMVTPGTERMKSAVFVPLLAGEEVNGFITIQNVERENAFSEADVNLLSTFASSMSITLENIRLFDETQRLLNETEQRAAELAIITSVQQGLASKLDMQAIYELVGDKMQEIFDAQSLLIVMFDHANEMAQLTYNREMGVRYYAAPYPFTGLHRYIIQSRNTVVINENSLEWQAKFGMIQLPGTAAPKSMIFVPLTSGYRVSGLISLQNLEREHAFSDNDVRLLETLASSMSV
ncbi:MAG TPA: GAF domain-containing protein, partial [Anaerolineales bacterium]|nr:GAF domain-containing protein [Anaerolineales bacterium]